MSEEDFKKFCRALAQSCLAQAERLSKEANKFKADEYERKLHYERRIDALNDLFEIYYKAHQML